MAENKSTLSTWLMPVLDLMMILIIGLLAVSGYISFRSSAEKEALAQRKVAEVETEIAQFNEKLDNLAHQRMRLNEVRNGSIVKNPENLTLEEIKTRINQLKTEIERLRAQLEPLYRQLVELAQEVRKLEDEADSYGRRVVDRQEEIEIEELVKEAERLKKEKANLDRKLASLEAAKVRQEELTPSVKLGVSEARPRVVEKEYLVILYNGKIYPITSDFFVSIRRGSSFHVKAKRSGLSVSQALASSSPLMKQLQSSNFKERGRVLMIVNNDSFAAYRVLRDKIVEVGVDYAWEPDSSGIDFYISGSRSSESGGISIPSQGHF